MEVVIYGLKISTNCRYLKITYSDYLNIKEDFNSSCFYLDIPKGFCKKDIIHGRISVVDDSEVKETDFIKLSNYSPIINGFKFTKLIQSDYVINQFIINNSDQTNFVIRFDSSRCEIIIPKIKLHDVDAYLCILSKNPYIKVEKEGCDQVLSNVYSYNITEFSGDITSNNFFEFNTSKSYSKYLLTSVKILDSFLKGVKGIVVDKGIDFIPYPKTKDVKSTNYMIYRFLEVGRQVSRRTVEQPLRFAVQKTSTISFELSCSDLKVLDDFKVRYQNLDLLSNFTMFNTTDSLGRIWLSNVMWSPIPTDFNQELMEQDSQAYTAHRIEFTATISYYEVYDETYHRISEVITKILADKKSYKD